jgi:plastocyanin
MRTRNVFTALGLGAFALLCLTPDSAQAQRRRLFGGGGTPPVYDQSWQPGYYGAPLSNWPGASYAPGMSYGPGVSYGTGTLPLNGAPMYQPQPYGYSTLQLSAESRSYTAPAYQPQTYPYPQSTAPCPPGQPLPQSALTSPAPQAMPSAPGYGSPQPMPSSAPGSAAAQPGATAQPAATHTVNAQDDYFEPKTINIQPGATVTWVNRGQHAHTVTFDVGRDSGDIAPGGSFSATFPHAGTYQYHCHHHKDMRGTVVVGEGGTGGAGSSTGAKY